MKFYPRYLLFFLLCLCSSFSKIYAKENDAQKILEPKKVYVELNNLIFLEDGMFIDLDGQIFPIQFLGYDENGYYASALYWICIEGHINSMLNWPVCKRCQKGPRPGP